MELRFLSMHEIEMIELYSQQIVNTLCYISLHTNCLTKIPKKKFLCFCKLCGLIELECKSCRVLHKFIERELYLSVAMLQQVHLSLVLPLTLR